MLCKPKSSLKLRTQRNRHTISSRYGSVSNVICFMHKHQIQNVCFKYDVYVLLVYIYLRGVYVFFFFFIQQMWMYFCTSHSSFLFLLSVTFTFRTFHVFCVIKMHTHTRPLMRNKSVIITDFEYDLFSCHLLIISICNVCAPNQFTYLHWISWYWQLKISPPIDNLWHWCINMITRTNFKRLFFVSSSQSIECVLPIGR